MYFIKKSINIFTLLFLTFTCAALSVLFYIRHIWPNADYEQILITLQDLSFDTIITHASLMDYFWAFLFFAVIYPLCYFFLNAKQQFGAAVTFAFIFLWTSGFFSYHFYKNTTSTLFEEEYAEPQNITYTFPEKKRNLILIYLESFEQNFSQAEYYEKNIIPHLTDLQNEDGGAFSRRHNDLPGAGFSIASLIASQCGIPLRYSSDRDIYATKYFLPQAVCFPEILKKNGYQIAIVKAADITFTDVHIFAKSHGYDEASGVDEILSNYPKEEHFALKGAFGGVNDETLFSFAKKKLAEFSPDTPFMLTLFSLDTHTPSAYHNPSCSKTFGDLRDVYMCTDKTVYNFIEWLKQSPYWNNTTVVIIGDHLLPVRIKSKGIPKRGIFNVFLNLPQGLKINPEKNFSTYDIAPSILESLNISISPRAFGLGRSLFSDAPTLIEKEGIQELKVRLQQNSEMYNKFNELPFKRVDAYTPYEMGTTITNKEILRYTDAYDEFLGIYYIDRLNLKISENVKNNVQITMRFNAMLSSKHQILITVNGYNVFTFSPTEKQMPPYNVSFDIPAFLIANGKLSLKFRNTFGTRTALQMGIAPLEIKLTAKQQQP